MCSLCSTIDSIFVNIIFKKRTDGILKVGQIAGDTLYYVAEVTGDIRTFILSLITYKQNKKAQQTEGNNYIVADSCMMLIRQI